MIKNLMGGGFSFVLVCITASWAIEENSEKNVSPAEYVHPIEGVTTACPLVSLQGSLLRHTFAGVPNYESLENGDAPEIRWVLVLPESEIQRLREAGFIPQEDIFTSEARG